MEQAQDLQKAVEDFAGLVRFLPMIAIAVCALGATIIAAFALKITKATPRR